MANLVESSWNLVDQARGLLAAVRIREVHHEAEARVRDRLARVQRERTFRDDLPVSWLLATAHVVMNAAAEEIAAGRAAPDAAHFINAVAQRAFAPAPPSATAPV